MVATTVYLGHGIDRSLGWTLSFYSKSVSASERYVINLLKWLRVSEGKKTEPECTSTVACVPRTLAYVVYPRHHPQQRKCVTSE